MIALSLAKVAIDALRANRLRSGLTLLGITIGVTSVMTIISALEGMSDAVEKDLARLGPATFIVQRIAIITSEEMYWDKIKRKPLDFKAVNLVEAGCELCEKVSPRAWGRARISYGDQGLRRVLVGGTMASYIDIVDIEVAQGRFMSQEDQLYRHQVVFIGDYLRETFFEGVDPVGKVLKLGAKKYTVIGVARKQGSGIGGNQDNYAMIPLSAHIKQFGMPRRGMSMVIKARSVEQLEEAMDQTRIILRAKRHVPYDKPDDFDMVTAESILELLNSITRILRMGLVGISSISLVVGGIVVMNIMMVSVTERTREIGIRKAIGAKQKHILVQFIFESLMLTLTGGIAGIIIGFLIAKSLVGMIDMEIEPSTLAIIAGLTISTGIGLIFGIYPAMKAARLDPIKALSYE